MSMLNAKQPTKKDYEDGRTMQSFKDETDINKILARAQVAGTMTHLQKHETHYGDFANFDFQSNLQMLTRGREIFDELPVELRSEFRQSPEKFFNYVNDPANKDRLNELLPALAEPGRQMLSTRSLNADALAAATPVAVGDEQPIPAASPAATAATPPMASAEASSPTAEPNSA